MTKNQKDFRNKRKAETFYKKAKQINVRARSYFKLEQIDKKFSLVKNNMQIIDLGAAPGGWLEYLDKKIETGKIIGIDLLEIKNQKEFSQNIEIIQDDFNEIEEYGFKDTRNSKGISGQPEQVSGSFDLVLSDMAPEFSGDSVFDRGRTHKLNLGVLDFTKKHLKKNGNCAFKSFEGEDLEYVRKKAKEIFTQIKEFKPQSSQKKSNEIFIVCLNKK